MRVAFVSREITPFSGGGIAPAVRAAAELLADEGHEVTIVTADDHRAEYEQRVAAGDPDLVGSKASWTFVTRPPEEGGSFLGFPHAYSAAVLDALRSAYGEQAPDVVEFCDYLGEGFATVQARHTQDPWLAETVVAIRLHTTTEICAVLDGAVADDHHTTALFEMERYCLRNADVLLWQGGDILATYERYYGRDGLAPAKRLPAVVPPEVHAAAGTPHDAVDHDGEPLRLLYLGRLERRKGPHDLAAAMERVHRPVALRYVGGDTDTAPLAASVAEQLSYAVEGDPRSTIVGPVPRERVADEIAWADVVVVPSRWECWPNVVLEAFAGNRPVLATPVGGLVEMVEGAGWLTDGTGPRALAASIETLAADPSKVRALVRDGAPRARFEELVRPEVVVEGYRSLVRRDDRAVVPAGAPPLVSVIVPYFELEATIEDTLRSIAAQTHPAIETIIVNDGSLRPQDADLWDLAERYGARVVTQPNAGLSAARNLGIDVSSGDYVLPLDADDELAPTFVSRCLAALEASPTLAYAGTWVAYVDEQGAPRGDGWTGYFPFGNWSTLMGQLNVAGVCTTLLRRSVFRDHGLRYSEELASYEDWGLYRAMAGRGLHGAIVPERLFRYRVRSSSMTRQDAQPHLARLLAELRAHDINASTQWEALRD